MTTTIIRGKYVLCKVEDNDKVKIISDGAVVQQDGKIIDVGNYDSLNARYVADEEIGSDRYIVLPGLVNAHQHGNGISHIQLGVLDDNLELWLIRRMGRRPVDTYLETMLCAMRLIESGVTTTMHCHSPRGPNHEQEVAHIIRGYGESGIRVAFALGIRNQNQLAYSDEQRFLDSLPPSVAARGRKYLASATFPEEEYFTLFDRLHNQYNKTSSRVKIFHGPLGPTWCSDDLLIRIKQSALNYRTGIHSHMLETMYQEMYSLKQYGKTYVEHLHEIGFLGPETSFAHCVWVSDADIEILAESGTTVCHNPSSNLRTRSGIAPINRMLEKGVNVALGTDNLSLNDNDDILQELRLCENLQHLPGLGKPSPSPGQLFRMVTTNGAKATMFLDDIGTIEKGKKADLVLINLENITQPYLDPEMDIEDAFLAKGSSSDVDTVLIDGEIVLRDGKHTKINKAEVISQLQESLTEAQKSGDVERRLFSRELCPYVYQFYQKWHPPERVPLYQYNRI